MEHMEFTGERFLPEVTGGIALEHRHRYLQASIYARDKDVLDIASGEGYGSAILSRVAKSVIGVDISSEAVTHAQSEYVARNLDYRQGSAAAIPLPDASVDLVVSFETIEHHDQHEEMFREIKRVLRPDGVLCISSPDRHEYSVVPGYENKYHVKELSLEEFENLLGRYFACYRVAGQRLAYGSLLAAREGAAPFITWHANMPDLPQTTGLPHAVYHLALASDANLPETFFSLLEDRVDRSDPHRLLLEADQLLKDRFYTLEDDYHALENVYYGLEDSYHELEGEADKRGHRVQELEDALRGMLTSRSWRITKPLRMAGTLARRLKSGVWSLKTLRAARREEIFIPPSGPTNVKVPAVNFIQECVSAHKAGQSPPAVSIKNICIYVASAGNHFFLEIARLIQSGFTDLDITATVVVAETFDGCASAEHADADLHLIVAPHELLHFIPQAAVWPHAKGKKWVLNTEQAHTGWFAGARTSFAWADLILDMDQDLAARLATDGLRAEHLPLGYSPDCRIFDGQAPIPLNDATNGIPQRIRDWSGLDNPCGRLDASLHDRPLDYCFFGASTERRVKFFARNAAIFANLEGYLRLKPVSEPLRVGKNTSLSTEGTSSIVRRSKVSLNIHQSPHSYFEWHRIILQGIWQGALVLSEPCTRAWPFRPNIDYIAADLDTFADTLEYLLLSNDGKALAERVRCRAYATLTEQCRLSERLQELLDLYMGGAPKISGCLR